jgi:hypothetical protein
MPWMPAFHTSQREEPMVFHDNSACLVGQKVAPGHRREGVGMRRVRCQVCADLKDRGQ